jgi:hypothetical protein
MSAEPAAPSPRKRPHWLVWLFALVGLLGILAIIFIAVTIFSVVRPRAPARVAGDTPAASFVVRGVTPLTGTNFVRIDIGRSERGRRSFSSSDGYDDRRNILLLDKTSGATRRLLPDNNRRIEQNHFLPARADVVAESTAEMMSTRAEEEEPPPAYYLLVVERREDSDQLDVLVGSLAGGRQGYVMQNLEGVDSVWMQSPTRIGLIVRERLNLFYRIVDIPSLRVVQSRRIAI